MRLKPDFLFLPDGLPRIGQRLHFHSAPEKHQTIVQILLWSVPTQKQCLDISIAFASGLGSCTPRRRILVKLELICAYLSL